MNSTKKDTPTLKLFLADLSADVPGYIRHSRILKMLLNFVLSSLNIESNSFGLKPKMLHSYYA